MGGFNEAEAIKPRKPRAAVVEVYTSVLRSFNEAEAIKPRKRYCPEGLNELDTKSFNEAEAIKPRKPSPRPSNVGGQSSLQ